MSSSNHSQFGSLGFSNLQNNNTTGNLINNNIIGNNGSSSTMPPLASHLEKFRHNKSLDNNSYKSTITTNPGLHASSLDEQQQSVGIPLATTTRQQRDPNSRPVNKLTVNLIKTYKNINEVCF